MEQQTATSEILGVIASSPTDIQPVLDVVAENAARLCEADDAVVFRIDGDVLQPGGHLWTSPSAVPTAHQPWLDDRSGRDRPADHSHSGSDRRSLKKSFR